MEKQKILIVGGGLAGLCCAFELDKSKYDITIIDKDENHSSSVAAGQINPVVFRRLTLSWRVEEFFPYAKDFYQIIEKSTSQEIFLPIKIKRFFSSEQEKETWIVKEKLTEFTPYLSPFEAGKEKIGTLENPFGWAEVHNAAYIDVEEFLISCKTYLEKENVKFINGEMDVRNFNPSEIEINQERYDKVIFCTGFEYKNLNIAEDDAVKQTKGEILFFNHQTLDQTVSLNRKCFILPSKNPREFKAGSNYSFDDASLNTTKEASQIIEANIENLLNEKVEITKQTFGIRPTTMDRRPICRQHKEFKNVYFFNGLGAKGYLIAPLLAKEFVGEFF